MWVYYCRNPDPGRNLYIASSLYAILGRKMDHFFLKKVSGRKMVTAIVAPEEKSYRDAVCYCLRYVTRFTMKNLAERLIQK